MGSEAGKLPLCFIIHDLSETYNDQELLTYSCLLVEATTAGI